MLIPALHKQVRGAAILAALWLTLPALAQTATRAASPATTMQLGVAATGVIEKIFVRDGDQVDAGKDELSRVLLESPAVRDHRARHSPLLHLAHEREKVRIEKRLSSHCRAAGLHEVAVSNLLDNVA